MATISLKTPIGVRQFNISGDTPTEEEMKFISSLFKDKEFQFTAAGNQVEKVEKVEKVEEVEEIVEEEPVIEGELEDSSLRWQLGRMETDSEKAEVLRRRLGEGTFEKVADGTFVIDQALVDPARREKYGLDESGLIYSDKPGWSSGGADIIDFIGEEGPAIVGGIVGSLAATGVGAPAAAAIAGLTAGAFVAVDEAVDYWMDLNDQSVAAVGKRVVADTLLTGAFEFAGRGATKLASALWRGRGPDIDNRVVQILEDQPTMTKKQAKKQARQEMSIKLLQQVDKGAKPTIGATGRELLGRAQAITEAVIGSKSAADTNMMYISKVMKEVEDGIISPEKGVDMLKGQSDLIQTIIQNNLANVDTAFTNANASVSAVLGQSYDDFVKAYTPQAGVPEKYTDFLVMSNNWFKAQNKALYNIAERQLGGIGDDSMLRFDLSGLKKIVGDMKIESKVLDKYFDSFNSPLFKLIDTEGSLSLSQLQQFKQAAQLAAFDDTLSSPIDKIFIQQIEKHSQELLNNEYWRLMRLRSTGESIEAVPTPKAAQINDEAATGPYASIIAAQNRQGYKTLKPADLEPRIVSSVQDKETLNEALGQGLEAWKKADDFFAANVAVIRNGNTNLLFKQAKNGQSVSNTDVIQNIVKDGNADRLRMLLKAVTPVGDEVTNLTKPGTLAALKEMRQLMESGSSGRFREVNKIIEERGLVGTVPKVEGFLDDLAAKDAADYAVKRGGDDFIREISSLEEMATMGENLSTFADSARNGLAKTWLDQAKMRSTNIRGETNYANFAQSFASLGDDVQEVLFGVTNAKNFRTALHDTALLGKDKDFLIDQLDIDMVRSSAIAKSIQGLREANKRSLEESKSAVARGLKEAQANGVVFQPDKMLAALLDNPGEYAKLKTLVGEGALEQVNGLKDLAMANLLKTSGLELTTESIQSGSWGKGLLKAIESQDRKGGLSAILGKDVVSAYKKLGQDAMQISDMPKGSMGGIVAAGTGAGLIGAVFTLGGLLTTVGTLGSMNAVAAILRSRPFLRSILSPKMRKSEYEEALRAGADLPSWKEARRLAGTTGKLQRTAGIASEIASQVLGRTTVEGSAQASEAVESRAQIGDRFTDVTSRLQPSTETIATSIPRSRPAFTREQVGLDASTLNAAAELRKEELRKLLYGTP